MNKLKELFNTQFNYDMPYDYEDMKLAIECSSFIEDASGYQHYGDFEDIIRLATWVKIKWNEEFKDLTTEERVYIQAYARRILYENEEKILDILGSDYDE